MSNKEGQTSLGPMLCSSSKSYSLDVLGVVSHREFMHMKQCVPAGYETGFFQEHLDSIRSGGCAFGGGRFAIDHTRDVGDLNEFIESVGRAVDNTR